MKYLISFFVLFFISAPVWAECTITFTEPNAYVTGDPIEDFDRPLRYAVFVDGEETAVVEQGPPIDCSAVGVPTYGEYEVSMVAETQTGRRSEMSNVIVWSNAAPKPNPPTDLSVEPSSSSAP